MPEPSSDPRPIDAAWRSFTASGLMMELPPVQRRELRRAFFAGSTALLGIILRQFNHPGKEPTDADMARMRNVQSDLARFARDLAEGRE